MAGSQGAGSSGVFDSAKDLRAFENEQGATSEAMPAVEKVRGIFSKLRRSWTKTANPRPPRPSLFRPRRELNSKFGVALDELEMMRTIGTRFASPPAIRYFVSSSPGRLSVLHGVCPPDACRACR